MIKRVCEISTELSNGWGDIKKRYPLIRDAYKLIEDRDYNPYPFYISLTPIESHLWQDIRQWPVTVRMYPQYPVGRFFVDFGDPWAKVAIEADGEQWHSKGKDSKRDSEIELLGWTIYRVPGRYTTKEGVISSILKIHYGGEAPYSIDQHGPMNEDYQPEFDNHKLLSDMGMPRGFIDEQISQFVDYWYGTGRPQEGMTWDEMFMEQITLKWR